MRSNLKACVCRRDDSAPLEVAKLRLPKLQDFMGSVEVETRPPSKPHFRMPKCKSCLTRKVSDRVERSAGGSQIATAMIGRWYVSILFE